MSEQIHLNDIGTQFKVTVKDEDSVVVDLSSASTLQLIFQKPSGDKLTTTASLINDGTDGLIQYITVSGDIDECGIWQMQARVVIGTKDFKTDIGSFKVYRNL